MNRGHPTTRTVPPSEQDAPSDPRALAVEVLEAMAQDCGPIDAEPYASWAKSLALAVLELADEISRRDASNPYIA